MSTRITAARAARQEALWPRLAALEKQVAPVAAKKPELAVPEPVARPARALIAEAQALLGRRQLLPAPGRKGLDYATLAVLLGQARTALEAFEAAHASWHADWKCLAWRIEGGEPLPVRRLLPDGVPHPDPAEEREMSDIKRKLLERITNSRRHAYSVGYRDAMQGKPEDDSRYNA